MAEKHRKNKADRHLKTVTAVRLKPETMQRLRDEAHARDLPMSYLVEKAVTRFLDNLIPADEWKLTRD